MRDKRNKSWTWIDDALVDRDDLTAYEKLLYVCLARHAGDNEFAFPGLNTLCKELGLKDKRTVVKYIKTLEEKGLIEVEKKKGTSNRYYLNNVEKVGTQNVPTTCNVPTYNDTTSDKVVTNNVPTSDVVGTSNDTRVVASNVTRGSSMKCTSNYTNTNYTKLTTSSSSVNIKLEHILQSHGLKNETCKNIIQLVNNKNITLQRLKDVLMAAQLKQWKDGAIYKALKEDWIIEGRPNSSTSSPISITSGDNITETRNKIRDRTNHWLSYYDVCRDKQAAIASLCADLERYKDYPELVDEYTKKFKKAVGL